MPKDASGSNHVPIKAGSNAAATQVDIPRIRKTALNHPLLSGKVVLPTPPINELFMAIKRIVILREPGCCFTAKSGAGKSYALTMMESLLRKEFPEIAIFRHVILNQQVPSIRAFFKHFLKTVHHDERRGETADLRERVVNRLIDEGRLSGFDLVVLLIDEAQEMALQDFKFLKDIGNELDKEGVQLVVIMMGEDPEFGDVIVKLRDQGRLDLVSRFTMRRRTFRGLSTLKDFQALLETIDKAVFPESGACAWPEFFIPKAWAAGLRLSNQAALLLDALITAAGANSTKEGFPARQLFLAIRSLLLDHSSLDSSSLSITSKAWAEAAQYALIEDAIEIAAKREMKRSGKSPKIKI
jgi:hypothetical protein